MKPSFFSLEGKETKVQDAEKYILKIRHLYEENCELALRSNSTAFLPSKWRIFLTIYFKRRTWLFFLC